MWQEDLNKKAENIVRQLKEGSIQYGKLVWIATKKKFTTYITTSDKPIKGARTEEEEL